jgi:putative DNA primase/helicase
MHAITYAERGWSVLPLANHSKQPAKFLRHGYLDATTDIDTITKWFDGKELNIGLGIRQSNLVVFDFDNRNVVDRKAWIKYMAMCVEAKTFSVNTYDGWHFYFKADPNIQFKGKLIEGIDIKHKGYVVLPPSIHPSGYVYKVEDDVEPVEIPQQLLEMAKC